jgi:hypothetical protein
LKKKIAATKNPEKRKALKAALRTAKKIAKLRKQLAAASEHQKIAIRKKIAAKKALLKQKTALVRHVAHQVALKKVAKIEAKLAKATDPKRIKALKKLLKIS